MSTVDTTATPFEPSPFGTVGRIFTAADLAALPEELPSGRVFYELDKGRLAIMSPPGYRHGNIQANIGAHFKQQGEWRGRGKACTDIGVEISRNLDTIYSPDVAFIVAERLPVRESKEGYVETIPDLVVEVRSKSDSLAELSRKARAYLAAGVQTVWIVDEAARTITIEEANAAPRVIRESESIPAPAAIPEFELLASRVFE